MVQLDAELSRIWGLHSDEIDARVATIDSAVAELTGGTLGDESRAAAAHASHQLAGTAGTFGFTQASHHAAAIQERLATAHVHDDAPPLAQLLAELRAALPPAAASPIGAPQ